MITNGIKGLLASKKGTLSLILLTCATAANLLGKLDSTAYAAVVGTIGTIYCWTAAKIDAASLGIK